jgi:two-component system, cell cycle sensor histidine kinase and response regulator CckA
MPRKQPYNDIVNKPMSPKLHLRWNWNALVSGILRVPGTWPDEVSRRRAEVLHITHLLLFFGGFLYLFLPSSVLNGQPVYVVATILISVIGTVWLRSGHLRSSGIWTMSVMWLMFTIGSSTEGGITSGSFAGTIAMVVFAGLAYGATATVIISVLSVAAGALLVYLKVYGLLPEDAIVYSQLNILSDFSVYISITGVFVIVAVRRIERTTSQFEAEIKERIRVEEILKESEEKFSKAFLDSPLMVVITRIEDGCFVEVNREVTTVSGYAREEIIGKDARELGLLPEKYDKLIDEQLGDRGKVAERELAIRRKDGETRICTYSGRLITMRGQAHLLSILQDVTEKKKAEQALAESERQYQLLAQNISDVIWIRDLTSGRYTFYSPSVERMLGYTVEEALNQELSDVVTPESLHLLQQRIPHRIKALHAGYDGPYVDVVEQVCRNGKLIWTEVTTHYRLNPESGSVEVYGVTRDITDRKLVHEELLKLRKAVDASGESIFMTDPSGLVTFVNPAFTQLYGYTPVEVVGKARANILKSDKTSPEEYEVFWETILSKRVAAGEIVNRTKDGRLLHIESSVNPILDDAGSISGFLAIQRDITDRKRSEEQRLDLERQLLHTQRLESLGVLAGGIAHDFNNLLVAILGNASLVKARLGPADRNVANLERLEKSAERAAELARQMLAYSGRGRFHVARLDINELITENADLFRTVIPRSTTLELNCAGSGVTVEADKGQMQQLIMNLITNASEAMGDGNGVITLSTGHMDCTEEDIKKSRHPEKPPAGRFAFLEAKDTGCGMDPRTQERMFDPFFTTKFTGRGLGMSAVLGIVKGHKGAIFVNSEPNNGTTIRVLFPPSSPVSADETVPAPEIPQSLVKVTGAGTILVVDDEESVLEFGEELVQELGFKCLRARDGEEAVSTFNVHGESIVCVLLDLTMPKKDGVETLKEMRRMRPQVPVILSSGYDEEEIIEKFAGLGLSGFVQKPYRFEDLKRKIAQAIGT